MVIIKPPIITNINTIPLALGEWSLFLDDQRLPPGNPIEWRCDIARSYQEAIGLVKIKGKAPVFVSFDHDLADEHYDPKTWNDPDAYKEKTGYDFAMWLINEDLDAMGKFLPKDFSYVVHSMNPIGSKNIDGLMSSYLRTRSKFDFEG